MISQLYNHIIIINFQFSIINFQLSSLRTFLYLLQQDVYLYGEHRGEKQ